MKITPIWTPNVSEPYGYVYVTYNRVEDKYYCGKHKSSTFDTSYYGSGVLLKKAMGTQPIEDFVCVPIDWADSAKDLHEKEIYWIKYYNAVNDPKWYNLIEDSDNYGKQYPSETYRTYRYPSEVPYIKLYLGEFLQNLNGLPTSCTEVLYQLLNYAKYANDSEPMTIYVNSKIKQEIIQHTNITSIQTIDNALTVLVKNQILFRIYRGTYRLNPYIFGKGDWRDIYELRLIYTFTEKGKFVERETRRLDDSEVSNLTEEQKAEIKRLDPILTLARNNLSVNENLFDKLVELCKKLEMDPPSEWYKDFLRGKG